MSAIEKCPVADPGEGPVPPPPLIFRPKGGPKGRKNLFGDRALPYSPYFNPPPPPLRSGSADDVRLIEI